MVYLLNCYTALHIITLTLAPKHVYARTMHRRLLWVTFVAVWSVFSSLESVLRHFSSLFKFLVAVESFLISSCIFFFCLVAYTHGHIQNIHHFGNSLYAHRAISLFFYTAPAQIFELLIRISALIFTLHWKIEWFVQWPSVAHSQPNGCVMCVCVCVFWSRHWAAYRPTNNVRNHCGSIIHCSKWNYCRLVGRSHPFQRFTFMNTCDRTTFTATLCARISYHFPRAHTIGGIISHKYCVVPPNLHRSVLCWCCCHRRFCCNHYISTQ